MSAATPDCVTPTRVTPTRVAYNSSDNGLPPTSPELRRTFGGNGNGNGNGNVAAIPFPLNNEFNPELGPITPESFVEFNTQ